VIRLRAVVATGGRRLTSTNLSIGKRTSVNGCLQVEPGKVGIALADGLRLLGVCPGICLTTEENHGKPLSG
jgi:hypothetical protein